MSAESGILFTVFGHDPVHHVLGGKKKQVRRKPLVATGSISGRATGVAIAGDFIRRRILGTMVPSRSGFNGFYLAV